jgi:hypothetical protein
MPQSTIFDIPDPFSHPKNHNLILIGQPALMTNLHLSVNADIESRLTEAKVIDPPGDEWSHKTPDFQQIFIPRPPWPALGRSR